MESEGGKDGLEVTPVLEVSRTEEGSAESSLRKHPLCDRLGNGGLPRSSEPVQPVDRRFVAVVCPSFDLVQNGAAGSLETTVTVAMSIFGLLRIVDDIVEGSRFSCRGYRFRIWSYKTRYRKIL